MTEFIALWCNVLCRITCRMRDGMRGVALEKLPDYCNIVVWDCK